MVYKASSNPKYDSNVANIQRNLNALQEKRGMSMWPYLKADGYYGKQTADAVRGFQQAYNCTPYDGIYGNGTDSALRKALSDAQASYSAVPLATSINSSSSRNYSPANYTPDDSPQYCSVAPVCSINSSESTPEQCIVPDYQDDFMTRNKNTETPKPQPAVVTIEEEEEEESWWKALTNNIVYKFFSNLYDCLDSLVSGLERNMQEAINNPQKLLDKVRQILVNFMAKIGKIAVKCVKWILEKAINKLGETKFGYFIQRFKTFISEVVSGAVNSAKTMFRSFGIKAEMTPADVQRIAKGPLVKVAGNLLKLTVLIDPIITLCEFDIYNESWWKKLRVAFGGMLDACISMVLIEALASMALAAVAVVIGGTVSGGLAFVVVAAVVALVTGVFYLITDGGKIPLSERVFSIFDKTEKELAV